MRIISKFHDYYDPVARNGIDKTIVYQRETRLIDMGDNSPLKVLSNKIAGFSYIPILDTFNATIFPLLVLFCGKTYVGAKVIINYVDFFEYNLTKILELCNIYRPKRTKKFALPTLFEQLYQTSNNKDYDINFFMDNQVPCAVDECFCPSINTIPRLTLNPRLKDYNFQKVIEPYTAFQEIQMYISGVLATGDKNPQRPIPDKLRAESKGFNDLSFRRQEHPRKSKRTTSKVRH